MSNEIKAEINVEFEEAPSRQEIQSGEEIKTLFGKLKKWLKDLKTVAFSGSYRDLSDKPEIPTVNNAKLTIQKNGAAVKTFTANASADVTANITVPTKVSELTNDSGYKTTDTTYSNFVKSGTGAKSGLVPAPPTTAGTTKYLREDGTWQVPPDNNTVYTHPTTSGNKHIPSGGSSGQILRWSADGTATWGADNNTTYSNFVKSGSGAKSGLVPAPSTTAGTTKYLREDGTWQVPPNTNFSVCDTANSTSIKTVTCTGLTLVAGARISVQFKNGSNASGLLFLNVNNTGNINVVDNQTDMYLSGFTCSSCVVREFIYDGSFWRIL